MIPTNSGSGPPESILTLVFACEVLCVAAAVVLAISFVQVPNFASQFAKNPLAAFVTSVDFVVDFVGSFF